MKSRYRLLVCLLLVCGLLSLNVLPCAAEEDSVHEVIAEATCPIEGAITPAKAEEQALLAAKKNALSQVGIQELDRIYINSLPQDVFDVSVLEKKKVIDGGKINLFVQIKALIRPDQLQAAIKGINPIWGGPAECYSEYVTYMNGKELGLTKAWTKNELERYDGIDGTVTINKFERKGNEIFSKGITLKNKKYASNEPFKMIIEEVALGSEQFNGIKANKKRLTYTYPNMGPESTYISTVWVDAATGNTLKIESESYGNHYINVYKVTRVGPVDDSVFTVPAGYTKVAKVEDLYFQGTQQNESDNVLDTVGQNVMGKVLDGLFK